MRRFLGAMKKVVAMLTVWCLIGMGAMFIFLDAPHSFFFGGWPGRADLYALVCVIMATIIAVNMTEGKAPWRK